MPVRAAPEMMMPIVDVCTFYTLVGGGVGTYVERMLHGVEIAIVVPGGRNTTECISATGSVVGVAAPRFPLEAAVEDD